MPSVTWEKGETKLGNDSPGIVIISWNNGTIIESHLLVAVTSDERRGDYICVASSQDGETRQTFVIEEGSEKDVNCHMKHFDCLKSSLDETHALSILSHLS